MLPDRSASEAELATVPRPSAMSWKVCDLGLDLGQLLLRASSPTRVQATVGMASDIEQVRHFIQG